MGLRLLSTIVDEVNINFSIFCEDLFPLIQDNMTKYLFQLLHVENVPLLSSSLKLMLSIFELYNVKLLSHIELFISVLLDILSNREFRHFHGERTDIYLESIFQVMSIRSCCLSLNLLTAATHAWSLGVSLHVQGLWNCMQLISMWRARPFSYWGSAFACTYMYICVYSQRILKLSDSYIACR